MSKENKGETIHCAYDKLVEIGDLKPNPRNPNKHPRDQIELLAAIISHQGWRSPIVVSNRSGLVVAGHGRLEAANLLQLKVAPVDYQDFESDDAETAHLLADNKLAELSETNDSEVASILAELSERNTAMLTGYSQTEIDSLLRSVTPPESFDDLSPDSLETNQTCPKCGYTYSSSSTGS